RHGIAVSTRGCHRDQVAGPQTGGQVQVVHDDVPALAVLAAQARKHRFGVADSCDQLAGVLRAVQSGAAVVASTALHADVGTDALAVLDGAHFVHGDPRGPGDGPARLHRDARYRQLGVLTFTTHDRGQRLGDGHGGERVVGGDVGDPQASTQVQLGQGDVQLPVDVGQEAGDPAGSDLEPRGVEDLRPDV